jgi:hypothetical protein
MTSKSRMLTHVQNQRPTHPNKAPKKEWPDLKIIIENLPLEIASVSTEERIFASN